MKSLGVDVVAISLAAIVLLAAPAARADAGEPSPWLTLRGGGGVQDGASHDHAAPVAYASALVFPGRRVGLGPMYAYERRTLAGRTSDGHRYGVMVEWIPLGRRFVTPAFSLAAGPHRYSASSGGCGFKNTSFIELGAGAEVAIAPWLAAGGRALGVMSFFEVGCSGGVTTGPASDFDRTGRPVGALIATVSITPF